MKRFLSSPNLPHDAGELVIGEKYAPILGNALKNLGISPLFVPDNPCVDPLLAGHADLSVLYIGEGRVCLAPYLRGSAFSNSLAERGLELIFPEITQRALYPHDVQLNACIAGKHLICGRLSEFRHELAELMPERSVLTVRQGYVKCSVCVVSENAVITADPGIASVLSNAGMDVLKISAGSIALEGFSYGFPGGSCFKISDWVMAFTGTLDAHPDRAKILCFLAKYGVTPLYLTDRPLFDIGGAIPLTEKEKILER